MTKPALMFIVIWLSAAAFPHHMPAATFTVNTTNDNGTGSLRQAIYDANISPGSDIIQFSIPQTDAGYDASSGVWVIAPLTSLPYITGSNLIIDGSSQTVFAGNMNVYGPEIMINGTPHQCDYAFSIFNARNVVLKNMIISGFTYGVQIYGSSSEYNLIAGNYIGTDAAGNDSLGNYIGIEIIGGPVRNTIGGNNVSDRNIVSGNKHIGIRIVNADSNFVCGNYVGTNRTGTAPLGNYDGISIEGSASYNIIGGNTPGDRNLVSGNVAYGIPFIGNTSRYNRVTGNYIGTDLTGMLAVPNTYGVLFDDGSSWNVVGTSDTAERNIISGNSAYGVFIYNYGTSNNTVEGNFIGTDPSGTMAVPNGNGIVADGAACCHTIRNNLISGNTQEGIVIHISGSDNHIITGNRIGTDCSGTLPLGNGTDGIRIAEGPKGNIIGGGSADGNIIAFNSQCGVNIMTGDLEKNTILSNSIFSNGLLGIDLFPPGPDINDAGDADSGANQGMNFPVIDSVKFYGGMAVIHGRIDTQNPEYCMLQIFKAAPDNSGYGEGMILAGTVTPLSDGTWCDTLYNVLASDYYTATATDTAGNTSEFSAVYPVPPLHISAPAIEPEHIFIFPNPFENCFTAKIQSGGTWHIIQKMELYDATGKFVIMNRYCDMNGMFSNIDVVPGHYVCRLFAIDGRVYSVSVIRK